MTTQSPSPFGDPRLHPWMIGGGVAVLVVAGFGFALARGEGGGLPVPPGQMQVEVVAPVEPDIQPGSTLEVGELVDGYTHVAAPPMLAADAYDPEYQTAWVEPLPPLPQPAVRVSLPAEAVVRSTQPQPGPDDGRRYGFDAPAPDYAAERRARQARLDRFQAEQAARGAPGAPATSPTLDRESAFY